MTLVKLSPRHERWVYVTIGMLVLSGVGWLVVHYLITGGDGLPHPSETWWLKLHGAAAMGMLIALGSLLPGHVINAWQARRNHRSGLFMLALISLLILTGYGLYYAGDESTRPWISLFHWLAGLIGVVALSLHVYLGRRKWVPDYMPDSDQSRRQGTAALK